MRKVKTIRHLVVGALLVGAVVSACDTKSPAGPSGVTPTTSTTTTTIVSPTTSTSTSTTTTQVLATLARRYSAFQAPANTISEMTLFFELVTGGSPLTATTVGAGSVNTLDSVYRVTGVWLMGNGTAGTLTGTFTGAVDPLATGGDLTAMFVKTAPGDCTAQRPFAGRVTPTTLSMEGAGPATGSCSPNPLNIPGFSMFRNDPSAPLPTTTTTSSVFTTSTTTSSIPCSYSVQPTNTTVPAAGTLLAVTISATSGCPWSSQSFADWIVARPPQGGTGSGTALFDVAANQGTTTRVGTLLVAGVQITVTQPPPADLVSIAPPGEAPPSPSPTQFCRIIDTDGVGGQPLYVLEVFVRNQGSGPSVEAPNGLRVTYVDTSSEPSQSPPFGDNFATIPALQPNTTVNPPIRVEAPSGCFFGDCDFTITVDVNNVVFEGATGEGNNSQFGRCINDGNTSMNDAPRLWSVATRGAPFRPLFTARPGQRALKF